MFRLDAYIFDHGLKAIQKPNVKFVLFGIYLPLEIRTYEMLVLRRGPRNAKNINTQCRGRDTPRTACLDL